jgi:hypothetical protein
MLKLSPPDILPSQAFAHYSIVFGKVGNLWGKFSIQPRGINPAFRLPLFGGGFVEAVYEGNVLNAGQQYLLSSFEESP